jgi:hypothetical protein
VAHLKELHDALQEVLSEHGVEERYPKACSVFEAGIGEALGSTCATLNHTTPRYAR